MVYSPVLNCVRGMGYQAGFWLQRVELTHFTPNTLLTNKKLPSVKEVFVLRMDNHMFTRQLYEPIVCQISHDLIEV